ncbi:MAG: hypothetical protein R2879_14775 [Saprospiraceae bacterium]
MILFGLLASYKENADPALEKGIQNTIDWILNQLDGDFKFIEQGKMAPTYYTWSCGLWQKQDDFSESAKELQN